MPDYARTNWLAADRPLPWFYWSGDTAMACVRDVVSVTRRHAYAHHIQRLMVTGVLGLLWGVRPAELENWYLVVYADAFDWVELPNVHGMALYADGGVLADGLYVSVEGSLDATTVIAKSVHCEGESNDATVERKGVAESVDTVAQVFVLRPTNGTPLNVRWTSNTYFKNVTPATLAGQRVEVQGMLVEGVLVAQKVSVETED